MADVNRQKKVTKQRFDELISCLSATPLPIEVFTKMANEIDETINPNDYLTIDGIFCTVKHNVQLNNFEPTRKHKLSHDLLIYFGEIFHFQPRKITTWKQTKCLVQHMEYLLEGFIKNCPITLKEVICKLKDFYAITRRDKKKLELYIQLTENIEFLEKQQYISLIKCRGLAPSLNATSYGDYFADWKKQYSIKHISIDLCMYNTQGENEFTFSVQLITGAIIKIQTIQKKKKIGIKITTNSNEKFDDQINKINQSDYIHTFSIIQTSMNEVIRKNSIDRKDTALIIDFFENLLIGKYCCTENIILSLVCFVSLFSFINNNGQWGIPTNDEFDKIIDMKLCMSYLYQKCGKEFTEERYWQYTKIAILERKLIPIPRHFRYAQIYEHNIRSNLVLRRFQHAKITVNNGKLTTIPQEMHIAQYIEPIQLLSDFYNIIRICETNFNCSLLLSAYSELLKNIKKFKKSKIILYECSLALQKILKLHQDKINVSINRTSIYLESLQIYLHKTRIAELEDLIHIFIQRTNIFYGNNRFVLCQKIIWSFNNLIFDIYHMRDLDQKKQEILNKSIKQIINIAEYTANMDPSTLSANFIKIYCDLYVFIQYRKNDWKNFERIIEKKLLQLNVNNPLKMFISICYLMDSFIKYYILNKSPSSVFIGQLNWTLKSLQKIYKHQKQFLFLAAKQLFPLSLILFKFSFSQYFLNIIDELIHHYKQHYTIKSLEIITNLLNTIIPIEKNLKFIPITERIKKMQNELYSLHIKAVTDLIELYIVPAWLESKNDLKYRQLKIIIRNLDVAVKDDPFFLEKLEEHYQKFLFADEINKWKLEDIFLDIFYRFNSEPKYLKLKPTGIKTYKKNGMLFEERKGYDVLSLIFGVNIKVLYLKIEINQQKLLDSLIIPINILGTDYVTGFGGGGKMKIRLSPHGILENSLLPLISRSELVSGKFGKALEALPFKESYYYWQRMLNPASQDGSVVTGRFTIMYMDDETVAFGNITNADGCGFIKQSTIEKLSMEISLRTPYSLRQPISTYQSMHFCKERLESEVFNKTILQCTDDIKKEINKYCSEDRGDQTSVRELYGVITTGQTAVGRNFVVIPARGKNTIIVPLSLKNSDLFLGKTPYETPFNMIVKKEYEICHTASENFRKRKAAESVAALTGFQYSFIGSTGNALVFMKGILIIIPDELWWYPNIDMICCTKDLKVDSRWVNAKIKPKHGLIETYTGVLTPIQKFGPESCAALSTNIEEKKWGSDYDGDVVTVYKLHKNSSLYDIISKTQLLYPIYSTPKIQKTFTPSRINNTFEIFRFEQIVQARTANLLTTFSKIHNIFIALKVEYQQKVAFTLTKIPFIQYVVKNILINEPNIEEMLLKQPDLVIQKVLSEGIKTGADVFKSKVDWTYLEEFQKIMLEIYSKMHIPDDLVYSKQLSMAMHLKKMNFRELALEIHYQKKIFDSFPLRILEETLNTSSLHKLELLSSLLAKQLFLDQTAQDVITKLKNRRPQRKTEDKITKQDFFKLLSKASKNLPEYELHMTPSLPPDRPSQQKASTSTVLLNPPLPKKLQPEIGTVAVPPNPPIPKDLILQQKQLQQLSEKTMLKKLFTFGSHFETPTQSLVTPRSSISKELLPEAKTTIVPHKPTKPRNSLFWNDQPLPPLPNSLQQLLGQPNSHAVSPSLQQPQQQFVSENNQTSTRTPLTLLFGYLSKKRRPANFKPVLTKSIARCLKSR